MKKTAILWFKKDEFFKQLNCKIINIAAKK